MRGSSSRRNSGAIYGIAILLESNQPNHGPGTFLINALGGSSGRHDKVLLFPLFIIRL
jgi:hypothetical protein